MPNKKHNLKGSYRLNGSVNPDGTHKDFSGLNNHITIANSKFGINDSGKQIQEFVDGTAVTQHLKPSLDGIALHDEVSNIPAVNITNRRGVYFNGKDCGIKCLDNLNIGDKDFEFSITMEITSVTQSTYKSYFGIWESPYNGNVTIHAGSSKIYPIVRATDSTYESKTFAINTTVIGAVHTYRVVRKGNVVTHYYDDTAMDNQDVTGKEYYVNLPVFIGITSGISGYSGPFILYDAFVSVNGVKQFHYVGEETNGKVLYDVTGNGNHGVVANIDSTFPLRTTNTDIISCAGSNDRIDLGIVPDLTTIIEAEFIVDVVAANKFFIGSYYGDTRTFLLYSDEDLRLRMNCGSNSYQFPSTTLPDLYSGQLIQIMIDCVAGTITINGVTSSYNFSSLTTGGSLPLFSSHSGTGASSISFKKIKIWQNGGKVRDMVPAHNGQFYDKVNNTMYSSQGVDNLLTTRTATTIPCHTAKYGYSKVVNMNGSNGLLYESWPTVTTDNIHVIIEGVFNPDRATTSLDTTAGLFINAAVGYYETGAISMRQTPLAPHKGLRCTICPIGDKFYTTLYTAGVDVYDNNHHVVELKVENNRVRVWVDNVLCLDNSSNGAANASYYSRGVCFLGVNKTGTSQISNGGLTRLYYSDDNITEEWLSKDFDETTKTWPSVSTSYVLERLGMDTSVPALLDIPANISGVRRYANFTLGDYIESTTYIPPLSNKDFVITITGCDFTPETSLKTMVSKWDDTNECEWAITLREIANGNLYFTWSSDGNYGGQSNISIPHGLIPDGAEELVVKRVGSELTFAFDGVIVATRDASPINAHIGSAPLAIGAINTTTSPTGKYWGPYKRLKVEIDNTVVSVYDLSIATHIAGTVTDLKSGAVDQIVTQDYAAFWSNVIAVASEPATSAVGSALTVKGNSIHNGGAYTLKQSNPALLTNTFWSPNGSIFADLTYSDIANCDESEGVYVSIDNNGLISDVITEEITGVYTSLNTTMDFDPNNFTIFGRFNSKDFYTPHTRTIFEKVDSGENYLIRIALIGNNQKVLSFTGVNGAHGNTSSIAIVNDGQDHVFACSYDGTDWKIYLDGHLDSTVSDPVTITNINNGCYIGKDINRSFNGYIGDIRVFDDVFSELDIINTSTEISKGLTKLESSITGICSNGSGQSIDLGEPLNQARDRIVCKFRFTNLTDTGSIVGSYSTTPADRCLVKTTMGNVVIQDPISTKTFIIPADTNIHTIDIDLRKQILTHDNTVTILSLSGYTTSNNLRLFSIPGVTEGSLVIYGLKWYRDGALYRDLIPHHTGAFIDKLNGDLFINNGTGKLIYIREPYQEGLTKRDATFGSDGVDDSLSTGLKLTVDDKIEFVGSFNSISTTSNALAIGQHGPTINTRFYIGTQFSEWLIGFGIPLYPEIPADNKIHKFALSRDGFYIDDVLMMTVPTWSATPLYTFNLFMADGLPGNVSMTYEYFKIWQNGVLTRHYVPVDDGTVLDLVNNNIISNETGGPVAYNPPEDQNMLLFATRDGVSDVSRHRIITNKGTVVGKSIVCTTGKYITIDPIAFNSHEPWTIIMDLKCDDNIGDTWLLGNRDVASEAILFPYASKAGFMQIDEEYKTGPVSVSSIIKNRIILAYVYAGGSTIDVYINGVLFDTITVSDSAWTINAIGKGYLTNDNTYDFNGIIYRTEIYSGAKSASCIRQDYEDEVRYW